MVTVIFPAAGQGKRMQAGVNKVFLELAGKPILLQTLLKFSRCPVVDQLIVVVAAEEVLFIRRALRGVSDLKPCRVVAGGTERQFSVANGLKMVDAATDIVLVHDAARPLVSQQTIENVIAEARRSGAAIAAVREKNTVKVVDSNGIVKKTPERAQLWEVQTPQGFKKELLEAAYQKAAQDDVLGTDDASLVERLGVPVKVVPGEYRNIKVTTPEDLLIVEAFLREGRLEKAKEGIGSVIADLAAKVQKHMSRPMEDKK